jgi:predicted TIM-barrel fold metal-dependent hydrolase
MTSAQIRSRLSHPVIDADGHWTELFPVFYDYIREVAGPAVLEKYRSGLGARYGAWYAASPAERQHRRMRRPPFWGKPSTTVDRAVGMLPALFRDRLDEFGLDVSIVYPSLGFTLGRDVADPELASAVIRAFNTMVADIFRPCADRLIPVGVVSLVDPGEAIAQLEHAHSLGIRTVTASGSILRPIAGDADWQADPAKRRVYVDRLGLDNAHDYDPVWRKFIELKMPATSHGGSTGWPDRSSPSNFVANHLGHFAQAHHLFARSLFMGGVTARFPQLKFGFLEGGAGWACNLYCDLVGHWEKRNIGYMDRYLRPTNIDRAELARLIGKYRASYPQLQRHVEAVLAKNIDNLEPDISLEELSAREGAQADEFAHVPIATRDDLRRLFAQNFYFGCEADDPMTAVAFDKRLGLGLKPMLGSDIGHFDVSDPAEVVEEAWEMVEHGLLDEADFRAFSFSHAVELCCGTNPDFFRGTVIEDAVRKELARPRG